MIIFSEHLRLLHSGTNLVLSALRDYYSFKRVHNRCVQCFKTNPISSQTIMGNLPSFRVSPASPFFNCGVDYAGPFLIKSKSGRGAKLVKSFICVFVCFATKCIHLELVMDLSTDTFSAALKRFIARRGLRLNIYSDNGKNFIGAKSELKELGNFLQNDDIQENIYGSLQTQKILWHLIPPRALNFEGLWEAGVKSVKFHLKRIAGNVHFTYELFYRFWMQVEAVLNSRPLCPLSSDPSDVEPLTPADFLIGRKLTTMPEPDLNHVTIGRLSHYQHVLRMSQHL